MKQRTGLLKGIGLCMLICVIGIMVYYLYATKSGGSVTEATFVNLTETAKQQSFNMRQELEFHKKMLLDVTQSLEEDALGEEETNKRLHSLVSKTHFLALNYFTTQGVRLADSGYLLDFPSQQQGQALEKVVYWSVPGETTYFLLLSPVFNGAGEEQGLLVGAFPIEQLRNTLLPFYQGEGSTYVVNQLGELIVSSGGLESQPVSLAGFSSFWKKLESTSYLGKDTVEEMQEKIRDKQSGNMIFLSDGVTKYMCYDMVGVSDWVVFTAVGQGAVMFFTQIITRNAFELGLVIVATFTLFSVYLVRQQRKHNVNLERVAYYDEMCACPNLPRFKLSAQQFVNQNRDKKFVMIKLDVDRFKLVNQTLGKEKGDEILRNLALALKENAGNNESCYARAHDDEFYVIQHYLEQKDLTAMRKSFYHGFARRMGEGFEYHMKFVSGVYYMALEHCTKVDEAIEKANIAHQKAKATGAEMCIYDKTFIRDALRKKHIEERMEAALLNEEYQVYLQPQYSLKRETVMGCEALVRWKPMGQETIYPDEFIPVFEENNFIVQLDIYMFERVCQLLRSWIDERLSPITVSVNFARNHLRDVGFVDQLCFIADKYQVPRQLLEVELTERAIAQDQEVSLQVLENLHENGFSLSMDDFGTGYSSLGLLKNTPVDVIKIDKSFFEMADDQPRTKAVLRNVLQLAKELNAYTIAEGVETVDIVTLLRGFGCDAVQGFYYGRPVCEEEFKATYLVKNVEGDDRRTS